MNYRLQDNRFFINPLIGCKSHCLYCYMHKEVDNSSLIRVNRYSIVDIIKRIKEDKRFVQGKYGSIISVGSYSDIFPIDEPELINISINWVIELLKLGNPIQIMSKNVLPLSQMKRLVDSVIYQNQLLYSTTITTFDYWNKIEIGTSPPIQRVETLSYFKSSGVPTNLMIKPFLTGITNLELVHFLNIRNSVDYYVVGELYICEDEIVKLISRLGNRKASFKNVDSGIRPLDCSNSNEYPILLDGVNEFLRLLLDNGVKAFRKSSCVNANVLKINNISRNPSFLDTFCVRCGNWVV